MALLSIIHLTLLSSLTRPPAPGGKAGKGKADGDITDVTTDDAQAETGRVAFDFMGASGGMKIRNVDDTLPSRWVMLQQDKLEELTASGAKVGGSNGAMNMAGKGSWTPLAKSTVVESGASTDFFFYNLFEDELIRSHFFACRSCFPWCCQHLRGDPVLELYKRSGQLRRSLRGVLRVQQPPSCRSSSRRWSLRC